MDYFYPQQRETDAPKHQLSKDINEDIALFLSSGGVIEEIPHGKSGFPEEHFKLAKRHRLQFKYAPTGYSTELINGR